jgi:hypothetical protein
MLAGFQQLSNLLPAMGGESFHVVVAAFLGITDVALAAILAVSYRYGAGIFFLCCPATILLTGYHSQFENFALLVGLAAWLLIRDGSTTTTRLLLSAVLLGVSLVIKHLLFLFPLWVLFWPKLGKGWKRLAFSAIACGTFALSFLPWMFDPPSRMGIIHNVFEYRSEFNLSLARLIVSIQPFATVSALTSSFLTLGWMSAVAVIGFVAARKHEDLFPLYLLSFFAFSPALRDQYLAIALLAGAIFYTNWPSWALAGTAVAALIVSPAEILHLCFNIVYYVAIVSTQFCAAALLFLRLRKPSPAQAFALTWQQASQRAVTLALGSGALVFVIFIVKLWMLPGAGPAPPITK